MQGLGWACWEFGTQSLAKTWAGQAAGGTGLLGTWSPGCQQPCPSNLQSQHSPTSTPSAPALRTSAWEAQQTTAPNPPTAPAAAVVCVCMVPPSLEFPTPCPRFFKILSLCKYWRLPREVFFVCLSVSGELNLYWCLSIKNESCQVSSYSSSAMYPCGHIPTCCPSAYFYTPPPPMLLQVSLSL